MEDGPGAEKPDPGQHALDSPRGRRAGGASRKLNGGQYHEGRAESHQGVGPYPGRTVAKIAIQPDNCPCDDSRAEAEHQIGLVKRSDGIHAKRICL